MSGDSGDIYQARRLMDMRKNPDIRYANMSRSEIDSSIKRRSTYLTTHQHTVVDGNGRQLRFYVGEKDVEHLVSDALGRAKGTLRLSDISTLHTHFKNATYEGSSKDTKGRKGVVFHYYKITIDGREMYLNIMDDKLRHRKTLHSITSKMTKS